MSALFNKKRVNFNTVKQRPFFHRYKLSTVSKKSTAVYEIEMKEIRVHQIIERKKIDIETK